MDGLNGRRIINVFTRLRWPPTKKENVSFTQKELKKWKRRGGGGGRNSNRPSVGCEQIQRRRLRRGKDGPARTFRLISRLFNL